MSNLAGAEAGAILNKDERCDDQVKGHTHLVKILESD